MSRPHGADHVRWKGGRSYNAEGYVLVTLSPDDPLWEHAVVSGQKRLTARRMLEHRLVMARHLGRPLKPTESVHHRNGVKDDNRIENLELWSRTQPAGQRIDDLVMELRALRALVGYLSLKGA